MEHLITSINNFSISLYTELAKNENGNNMFFSPFSIHVILFLASVATDSNTSTTFKEIINALQLSKDHHSLLEYKNLLEDYNEVGDNLILVTGMFVDSSFNIDDTFRSNSIEYFKAYLESLDFKNDPNSKRQSMNAWVSNKTNQKIIELFPQGSISKDTKLVLANAMHFKCAWKHTFDDIGYMTFNINSENSVNVKMMFLQNNLNYYYDVNLKYAALELPYQLRGYSMIILLPDHNLSDLENNISQIKLSELKGKMELCNVSVYLPRFKIEHSLDLQGTLSKLGCTTMFKKDEAKFSKISNQVWVNKVMHKACIDVDEKGTEAAASTGASMRTARSIPLRLNHKEFKADHPFIFFILSKNGSVLFVGRVAKFDEQTTATEEAFSYNN